MFININDIRHKRANLENPETATTTRSGFYPSTD